jgi:hypothetical protein
MKRLLSRGKTNLYIINELLHNPECTHRVKVLQSMINKGEVWRLAGYYGRLTVASLENGHQMLAKKPITDYYGNHVESRTEVDPGSPGSYEYVKEIMGQEYADMMATVDEEYSVDDLPEGDVHPEIMLETDAGQIIEISNGTMRLR